MYAIKKACLLGFLSIISISSFGQVSTDSIKALLAKTHGLDQYNVLIDLVRAFGANNENHKALEFAKEGRTLAFQYRDTFKIINASRIVGQLYNRLDRAKDAEQALKIVLPWAALRSEFRNDYKAILNNLAIAYAMQARYDEALEIHFKNLKLREEDGDESEMSVSFNNIGFIYYKLHNYQKALEYFEKARLKNGGAHVLVNIGLCYNGLSDFSESLKYFTNALEQCGEHCYDKLKVEAELGLGISYYNLNEYSKAMDHLQISLDVSKRIGNQRFEAENLVFIGRIYNKDEKLMLALDVLSKCEDLSYDGRYNELLIESYLETAEVYRKLNNSQKAYEYQSKYITLKDSIYSSELIDRLAKIQTDFEQRQNLKTIADKDEVIQRQRALNIAIVIIAILAGALVFVLYRSNRIKKKVNAALSEAKAIIEDQNKQLLNSNIHLNKELEQRNIELEHANDSLRKVNDELDNFIYKTSHDIRGPLASLKGMCNVALIDVVDPIALGYLNKIDITADKLNSILTRLLIVNQLNHSVLGSEPISFEEIISDILAIEKKKGLPDRFVVRTHVDRHLEFHSDREFVKIILENLIANAIKFYNDSERAHPFVDVSIVADENAVKIRVIDNGIGIKQVNPDKIFQMFSRASERSQTGGIGLYITKTAVQKLNGTIALRSTHEGYTEFLVVLPHSRSKVLA